jgi:hypothetical protein
MRHIALVIADRPVASSGCGPWFILFPEKEQAATQAVALR